MSEKTSGKGLGAVTWISLGVTIGLLIAGGVGALLWQGGLLSRSTSQHESPTTAEAAAPTHDMPGMPGMAVPSRGPEDRESGIGDRGSTRDEQAAQGAPEGSQLRSPIPDSRSPILYWTCGMHPSVHSDKPGKCPICGMDLVPVYASQQSVTGEADVVARLELTEQQRASAAIETVPVTFRHLDHEINTTGRLTLDERRVTHVHTRIGGWLDQVFVKFTGVEIAPGDPLVSIYSEELVTAQEEYLLALRNLRRLRDTRFTQAREGAEQLLEASRQRLLRWEITPEQIDELARTGEPSDHLTLHYVPPPDTPHGGVVMQRLAIEGMRVNRGDQLYTVADLSTLWMMADIYEYEMAWISVGQQVEIRSQAYPGRVFEGEIAFIEPTLDPQTRTVKVRVDVHNPDMELRPEMYVDARIHIPLDHSNTVLASLRDDAQRRWAARFRHSESLDGAGAVTVASAGPTPSSSSRNSVAGPAASGASPEAADPLYACPMHPEVTGSSPDETCPKCGMHLVPVENTAPPLSQDQAPEGTVLAIPDLALLRTGERELVYVEERPGVYVGREVITGPSGTVMIDGQRQTYVPVLAGLDPGMRVVTRGNFLLDSQSTLTGAASAAYGSALDTGGSIPSGHQH